MRLAFLSFPLIIPKWTSALLIGFFGFLNISLLLGDGKQHLVEVFLVMGLLGFYFLLKVKQVQLLELPNEFNFVWAIVLFVSILLIPISSSPTYSISALVRWSSAFVIFVIFYSYAKKISSRFLAHLLIIFTLVALGMSVFLRSFPQFMFKLPPMNLILSTYGHNSLVILALLTLPLAWKQVERKITLTSLGYFLILLFVMFASSARGSLIVIGLFFIFILLTSRTQISRKWFLSVMLILTCIIFVVNNQPEFLKTNSSLSRVLTFFSPGSQKTSIWNSRSQYWVQAQKAIWTNPIFGSGPGTFYLDSKQYATQPFSYSYYAHNFLLQTLAEYGLLGSLPILTLIGITILGVLKKSAPDAEQGYNTALTMGVILTFGYSFIDYSLDFLVIWLFFWLLNAFILGKKNRSSAIDWKSTLGKSKLANIYAASKNIKTPQALSLTVLILSAFYGLSITATFLKNIRQSDLSQLSFWVAPFRYEILSHYINGLNQNQQLITPQAKKLVTIFYKQDPEAMTLLANNALFAEDIPQTLNYYDQILVKHPKNWEIHKARFYLLLKTAAEPAKLSQVFAGLNRQFLSPTLTNDIDQIDYRSPDLISEYSSLNRVEYTGSIILYLTKANYQLGLSVLDRNPLLTQKLWRLARDSYPMLGVLQTELASLEYFTFKNKAAALQIINECRRIPEANLHCGLLHDNFDNLTPPGGLARNIFAHH